MTSKKKAPSKGSTTKIRAADYVTGCPTKYRPEFCEQLVELMSKGKAFEQFAAHCLVSVATIYNWTKEHKEFLEAKKTGEALSLNWWMDQGQGALNKKTFRDTTFIFNMKCRFAKYGFNPDGSLNSFHDGDDEDGFGFQYESA